MTVEQAPAASDPQAALAADAPTPPPDEGTPSDREHPSSTDEATPDPIAQVREYLDSLPEDALARLAEEHPRLRSTFDQRTRTLLQRHEAERQRLQKQADDRAAAEAERKREFERIKLAREGDYDAERDILSRVYSAADREQLKQDEELRAHFREALKDDPEVRAYYAQTLGQEISAGIVQQVAAHPALASLPEERRWKVLNQPDGSALVDALKGLFTDGLISTKDAESMAAAAKQATLDAMRGGSRQPDTGPNAVTPAGSDLTRAAVRGMSQAEKIARAAEIAAAWEAGALRA